MQKKKIKKYNRSNNKNNNKKNNNLKIEQKLVNLTINASLLEIRSWIKPGNVHKTQNFPGTTYEDFITAATSLEDTWFWYFFECKKHFNPVNFQKLAGCYVEFINKAVNKMMDVQDGGNVLLGHILLLGLIFIPSVYGFLYSFSSSFQFWKFCFNIIENSTPQHTIKLYKAIRKANPGGMGSVEKYDLYSENAFEEIIQDNVNLKKIFEFSSDRDSIAECIATNFKFIREEILPKLNSLWEEYEIKINRVFDKLSNTLIDKEIVEINFYLNEFIIRLYLFILSKNPDTLIIRKNNLKIATEISNKASNLYQLYFLLDKELWIQQLSNFDYDLQQYKGKRNPGTTADLLAVTLYIKLILYNLF
ncbi:MAG: triphosphoribosyl-dephospho-CoA synthase [Promethearchaeota archaeon]